MTILDIQSVELVNSIDSWKFCGDIPIFNLICVSVNTNSIMREPNLQDLQALSPAYDRWTIAFIIKILFIGLKYDDEYFSNLYTVEQWLNMIYC